jgi:carotenoid cleavage dioxygenase
MDDVPCDFPRIHEGYTGRPHRYAYVGRVGAAGDEQRFTGVMKYDLRSGSAETLAWGRGRQGGEVVFVPRRGARDEDDGYLLGYVWDQLDQRSELCIVDARDLYARPLARVILPQRVPFGFHGLWLDAAQLL